MKGSFWTPHRDGKLRKMWGKRKASEIATELGTTPNAIIGRIHRILGTYREKIAKQLAATQEVAHRRRKLREKRQHAIMETMLRRIDAGLPRDKAIARARLDGGTLQSIGAAIGLSREGVRQIGKRTRAS